VSDLAVLVPSRGRPRNVARLISACERTCRADTVLHFGFDDDDPQLLANLGVLSWHATGDVRARMGLGAWTNALGAANKTAPYLASLGDDMVPVTDGWDEQLIQSCNGTGMAYPRDDRRDDIPEAVVMSRDIPDALGWICEPTLKHWYVDTVWGDLGRAAGCLTYRDDVLVKHRNPLTPGGDKADATNSEAAESYAADMTAYQKWRLHRMRADIETVRTVCSAARR
jgi:hypothetical protein